jgi:transposase
MLTIGGNTRVWLATGVTDLRRGFCGLQAIITHELGCPALNGDLYIFANRQRDLLKMFFFDTGGIWICAKRLERGTYRWPQPGERLISLSPAELQLLVSGIDLSQARRRSWWQPPGSFAKPGAATRPLVRPDDPAAA